LRGRAKYIASTHPSLYVRSLTTTNFTWIWAQPPSGLEIGAGSEDREGEMKGMKARVQVRHVGGDVEGWVYAYVPPPPHLLFSVINYLPKKTATHPTL